MSPARVSPRKRSGQDSSYAGRKRSSDAIENQLERYRSMRDFDRTAEPRGGPSRSRSTAATEGHLPFVIQKHAATRLHYDFRLGWNGVLKSWAVTKGPSYVPSDKRLAVQVEDHPIEYGGFEGVIPKGQYGGGTVMLWDEGTWKPQGNAEEGLRKGNLKFTLHGKKLVGDWALIRMGGKAAEERKPNWLLIKERDGKERSPDDPPITEEEPDSVITGRDLDAIAANQDHVWDSQQGAKKGQPHEDAASPTARKRSASKGGSKGDQLQRSSRSRTAVSPPHDAPKEALPKFVSPQLALAVKQPPEGTDWVHELKLDGYRIQARIDRSKRTAAPVTLITRGGLDWTDRMPEIASALSNLPVKQALLDGEVAVFDKEGRTSFALLQASFQEAKKQARTYVVFDLLHLDGHNLRPLSLERRKEVLESLIASVADEEVIRFGEHLRMSGKKVFEKACQLGAEGVVSKRASSAYVSGRNGSWLKVKCLQRQEFVIGGFTLPSKGGVGFGALLLGYYQGGKLIYAGRTGTGFTQKMRVDLRSRLDAILRTSTPFASVPSGAGRQAKWVEPKLVCEVNFNTLTADNLVRQASFQGLREDKPVKSVQREIPVETEEAKSETDSEIQMASTGLKRSVQSKVRKSAKDPSGEKRPARPKTASSDSAFPIKLTHPDKEIDSETKLTKRELADYFWAVRESMLPYIVGRPLSIVRCPRGSTQPCFYQKHLAESLPDGIEGIKIRGRRSGEVETYITIPSALGLAGLAQMGVLEIHPWGSTNKHLERPDMLVFDLDPDQAIGWKTLADSARELRERLRSYGLESFLKTTGGKGLHVVAPILPEPEWPVAKEFAHAIALRMEAENKALYLTKMTKTARKGKIFVDYLRNDRGATSIAPFSPRARSGAPVAAPLEWRELEARERPRFLVADFEQWRGRLRHDPWKKFFTKRQSIPAHALESRR
jgi:bifunctional non-homologous end joining protein LigD